jgi:hypothetical protein
MALPFSPVVFLGESSALSRAIFWFRVVYIFVWRAGLAAWWVQIHFCFKK